MDSDGPAAVLAWGGHLEQQGGEGGVVQLVLAQIQPLQVGQTGQSLGRDPADLVVWTHKETQHS